MDGDLCWDIDPDTIEKGTIIRRDDLVRILGFPYRTYDYQLKLNTMVDDLQRCLWNRGKPFTVVIKKGEIHALDDSEATEYNRLKFKGHLGGLRRSHRKLLAVDKTKLAPEQVKPHERSIIVQSAVLSGIVETRKGVEPIVHRRATPGLPPAEAE